MIEKTKLVMIRNTFSVHHLYTPPQKPNPKVEIGHFDGAMSVLVVACIEAHTPDPAQRQVQWLSKAVFGPKGQEFVCAKDAHVHVMVALETLINVSE